jgi:hypothetical protein
VFDGFYNGDSRFAPQSTGWFDISRGRLLQYDMGTDLPATPAQNFWSGNARTSEFELLYACMKGGITGGLDSLFFTELFTELDAAGATGF